jgi:hypothetical protein
LNKRKKKEGKTKINPRDMLQAHLKNVYQSQITWKMIARKIIGNIF